MRAFVDGAQGIEAGQVAFEAATSTGPRIAFNS